MTAVIKIELVTLPLNSGPKLVMGNQVCLGDLAVRGNFAYCLIIVVIFMGLGACRLEEILKSSNGW